MATLLVIDDDIELLELIKLFFSNHLVFTHTTAEDIVKQYRQIIPDVVILDKNLPGSMTGEQALARLRREHISVPIIIYSADYSNHNKSDVRAWIGLLDGDEVLSKPFDLYELEQKVDKLVAQGSHYS